MSTRAPAAPYPDPTVIREDVARALAEDVGTGDVTANLLPASRVARATITAKEPGVLAGAPWLEACFRAVSATCQIDWHVHDGQAFEAGTVLCDIMGSARAIVTAERSALNFLQTLSATATATSHYVRAIVGTGAVVLDTRKTIPGLRQAQKYAVRCGGGQNHRIGLFDAYLIKENHIAAAGSIEAAVSAARTARPDLLLEVEVESLSELDEALNCGVKRVLVDEFSREDLVRAVDMASGRCEIEVSGGVTLETIRSLAETGVQYISVGAITKHIRAIDLSLRLSD